VTKDFGEDTFTILVVADNAMMLVDAKKGIEPQTKKKSFE
jgi:peptide chain release factor 3